MSDDEQLAKAMADLAASIKEAEEAMLDLEEAIDALRLLRDPALAADVELRTVICIQEAMRA